MLFCTAFGGSWKDNAKWMPLFVTVWGAMIVPKATVRVVAGSIPPWPRRSAAVPRRDRLQQAVRRYFFRKYQQVDERQPA